MRKVCAFLVKLISINFTIDNKYLNNVGIPSSINLLDNVQY